MRIWFNHWFSTVYNLINAIKEDAPDIYVIGSNQIESAVYKLVCNEFYIEPVFEDGAEYAMWCLNFCKEHKIDVFFPRRGRTSIVKILDKFSEAGIKVMLDNNEKLIEDLDNKIKTAKIFKDNNICKVPEMLIATNLEEFKSHYKYLKSKYPEDRVCFKYAKDEGGISFRVIDEDYSGIKALRSSGSRKIDYNTAVSILGSVESFEPLIVMIYLKGPEISIDSLMTSKGFVGCTRTKMGTRCNVIDPNSPLIEISEKFAKVTGIKNPYNLQLRMHNGEYYLLEVNTRMAGGTYKCKSAGINFAYLALCDLTGNDFEIPSNTKKVIVSEIETPLLLEDFNS